MFLPSNITLQFGDTGDFVAELQRRLSLINLFNEAFINATFDGNTVNAVKSFQSMQSLRMDGIAGPETLRRLNGMISGDTSNTSSDSNSEEEEQKKARANALLLDAIFAEAQTQTIDPTLINTPEEKREAPVAEKPVVAAPPPRSDMAQTTEVQSQQQNIELIKQHDIARQQQQQPPQPTAEELQARLMQQQAEMAKLQEQLRQQQAPKPEEAAKQKEEPKAKEEQAVVERKPFSAMLQKLVDYIESKLPRSVMDEVKSIGQAMARAGVREAAMPTEAVARAPELEAGRGAGQQQQRG